jgi:phosphoserine phosphatase
VIQFSGESAMSLGVFLDLDGVLTPKKVNLQYAAILGVESDLVDLEDAYTNGEITSKNFGDRLVALFRKAKFTQSFARKQFSRIVVNTFVEELLQASAPNVFIVSSSPSYYVDQFATKYGIPDANVICSRYAFDAGDDGRLSACRKPCGSKEKSDFVRQRSKGFAATIGVGDSPQQDSEFLGLCGVRVLMGAARPNYLHAEDLYALRSLVLFVRRLLQPEAPSECRQGVAKLLEQSRLESNVFIITPFRDDARYEVAIKTIKSVLKSKGLRGWTAADAGVEDDIWANVRSFMHACQRGVVLVTADEIREGTGVKVRGRVQNPNVMLEAGYMLGQGKKVLLLKDNRVQLPADWLGRLWEPINFDSPQADVAKAVRKWTKDLG